MSDLEFLNDDRRGCAPGKADPEDFFATRAGTDSPARKACLKRCPYQQQCLNLALDRGERFGIWGGVLMSAPLERRRAVTARQDQAVTDLWAQGINDADIALRLPFNLHPGTVAKIRKRLNLPAHHGPGGRVIRQEVNA